ncbi:hypothetical protein Mapa_007454 [Marchantia paleacea]|nr:hypothetical protein Mapa_007454 [Marchantia paleacea]
MSRDVKSHRGAHISDRDGRDDRRGEDLSPAMDVDSDDGGRSPRSRRFPFKVERRRERDWGGSSRDRVRERDRDRRSDRVHDRERERERDRDWEKERDRGERGERGREGDRERERSRKRERERDSRRSRSPRHDHQWATSDDYESRKEPRIQGRGRDTSIDRDKSHKKGIDHMGDDDVIATEGQRAAIVAEFVDGIVREHEQHVEASYLSSPAVVAQGSPAVAQADEEEMMKKLGIPVGFTTTKGKYVSDANHSAVKLTTKRTPRQYMNRRGGFNRPLPAETNR